MDVIHIGVDTHGRELSANLLVASQAMYGLAFRELASLGYFLREDNIPQNEFILTLFGDGYSAMSSGGFVNILDAAGSRPLGHNTDYCGYAAVGNGLKPFLPRKCFTALVLGYEKLEVNNQLKGLANEWFIASRAKMLEKRVGGSQVILLEEGESSYRDAYLFAVTEVDPGYWREEPINDTWHNIPSYYLKAYTPKPFDRMAMVKNLLSYRPTSLEAVDWIKYHILLSRDECTSLRMNKVRELLVEYVPLKVTRLELDLIEDVEFKHIRGDESLFVSSDILIRNLPSMEDIDERVGELKVWLNSPEKTPELGKILKALREYRGKSYIMINSLSFLYSTSCDQRYWSYQSFFNGFPLSENTTLVSALRKVVAEGSIHYTQAITELALIMIVLSGHDATLIKEVSLEDDEDDEDDEYEAYDDYDDYYDEELED